MEVHPFILEESHRGNLEELLLQLSKKKRNINLTVYPNVHCVGAFDNEKLVGFAQLFILPKTTFKIGQLEDVIVHTGCRGQGIGTKILNEVISIAKREGCAVINLTTRPERKEAWTLFESSGFIAPGNQALRLILES
jgi:diamine N-acetyltransferase